MPLRQTFPIARVFPVNDRPQFVVLCDIVTKLSAERKQGLYSHHVFDGGRGAMGMGLIILRYTKTERKLHRCGKPRKSSLLFRGKCNLKMPDYIFVNMVAI